MTFKIKIFILKKAGIAVRKPKYKIDISVLENKQKGDKHHSSGLKDSFYQKFLKHLYYVKQGSGLINTD